jgi:hypothetical protein
VITFQFHRSRAESCGQQRDAQVRAWITPDFRSFELSEVSKKSGGISSRQVNLLLLLSNTCKSTFFAESVNEAEL